MIAAIDTPGVIWLVVGAAIVLSYAVSPKNRPYLPSAVVAYVGMVLFMLGLKNSSWPLGIAGVALLGLSGAIFFAMGGMKKS